MQAVYGSLIHILRHDYAAFLTVGFTQEELDDVLQWGPIPEELIAKCHRNPEKLQYNAQNGILFQNRAVELGVERKSWQAVISLQNGKHNSDQWVVDELISREPAMKLLLERWQQTALGKFELSSVGLAIGHANYRRETGENPALSTWL